MFTISDDTTRMKLYIGYLSINSITTLTTIYKEIKKLRVVQMVVMLIFNLNRHKKMFPYKTGIKYARRSSQNFIAAWLP
jgi:hypothetical protein